MSGLVFDNGYTAAARAFDIKKFSEVLEDAMKRESKETKKTSFAPSGLGYSGACPRYWYYAFNGAEFVYDTAAEAVANMNAGTDAGARLAKVLEKAGILVEAERPCRHDDPPIFGYIDAIVNWSDSEVVAEVKTAKNSSWNYRATHNTVPAYQLIQLLIYMYVTNHERGFFITENKDTHQLFILPIKMNDEYKALVERVFEWMRMVKDNADNGELPTRPFNKSSMQCKGCPVKNTCWDGWTRGKVNGTDPNPGKVTLPILDLEVNSERG